MMRVSFPSFFSPSYRWKAPTKWISFSFSALVWPLMRWPPTFIIVMNDRDKYDGEKKMNKARRPNAQIKKKELMQRVNGRIYPTAEELQEHKPCHLQMKSFSDAVIVIEGRRKIDTIINTAAPLNDFFGWHPSEDVSLLAELFCHGSFHSM